MVSYLYIAGMSSEREVRKLRLEQVPLNLGWGSQAKVNSVHPGTQGWGTDSLSGRAVIARKETNSLAGVYGQG